jgi:hypothetical protein
VAARTPEDRVYYPVRGRSAYGARLLGTDPRKRFEREWCHRRQSLRGERGLWVEIGPEPGWYEVQTFTQFGARQRAYVGFAGIGQSWSESDLEPVPEAWIETALSGPVPGQPGAWNSLRCHCGALICCFTEQGFPRCFEHCPKPQEHQGEAA